jgi:hypothetical protein
MECITNFSLANRSRIHPAVAVKEATKSIADSETRAHGVFEIRVGVGLFKQLLQQDPDKTGWGTRFLLGLGLAAATPCLTLSRRL